jgi:putative DNA primase/helicase
MSTEPIFEPAEEPGDAGPATWQDDPDVLTGVEAFLRLEPTPEEIALDGAGARNAGPRKLTAAEMRPLSAPSKPMAVARQLAAVDYTHPERALRLRHWRGSWWSWHTTAWAELEQRAVASAAYTFTEHATYWDPKTGQATAWAPTRHKIGDLLDALAAIVHLPEETLSPGWLDGRTYDGLLVSCANGLLDVSRRELLPHTPAFFNATSVPFPYDADALEPTSWLRFLENLWGDDADSVGALQEWFGYVVSGRLDLQKILLLIGPTRAGKGVIARILGALVGAGNVAGPTLSSLNGDFGLAPLLGKTLAVVSDARLNGRNSHVVVERLLSISGEDTLTVNRKYREQWTGRLPTRLMLCSNELPELGDASAAIAGRFLPLLLTRSWLGREDHELDRKLHAELPEILNWALDGLERLAAQGRFTRPPGADEAMVALQDLASPVAAFVRDRCRRDPEAETPVDVVYAALQELGRRQRPQGADQADIRP